DGTSVRPELMNVQRTTRRVSLMVAICLWLAATGVAQDQAPESQTVHILVGRSVLINTHARLRRVLVGNPKVIESITTSPTQVVVTASAPGASSLVLWEESGATRILEVFVDVDVSTLRAALQQAFPGQQLGVESQEGKVVLTGLVQ